MLEEAFRLQSRPGSGSVMNFLTALSASKQNHLIIYLSGLFIAAQKWSCLSERAPDVWDGAGIGLDLVGAKFRQGLCLFLMEFAAWLGSALFLIPRRFPK